AIVRSARRPQSNRLRARRAPINCLLLLRSTWSPMPDFVLEIGIEEVPASAMVPALGQLRELLGALLQRERIAFEEVRTLGTPRRLAAIAAGVTGRQDDAVIEI